MTSGTRRSPDDAFAGLVSFGGGDSGAVPASSGLSLDEQRRRADLAKLHQPLHQPFAQNQSASHFQQVSYQPPQNFGGSPFNSSAIATNSTVNSLGFSPAGLPQSPFAAPSGLVNSVGSAFPVQIPNSLHSSPRAPNQTLQASSTNSSNDAFADLLISSGSRVPTPAHITLSTLAGNNGSPFTTSAGQTGANTPLIPQRLPFTFTQTAATQNLHTNQVGQSQFENNIWDFDTLAQTSTAPTSPLAPSTNFSSFDPFFEGDPKPVPQSKSPKQDPFNFGGPSGAPLSPGSLDFAFTQQHDPASNDPFRTFAESSTFSAERRKEQVSPPVLPPRTSMRDESIAAIVDMGFNATDAGAALDACDGSVTDAVALLLQQCEAAEEISAARMGRPLSNKPVRSAGTATAAAITSAAAAGVMSNARNFLQFGKAKLTEAYAIASEKVAQVVDGFESSPTRGSGRGAHRDPTIGADMWDHDAQMRWNAGNSNRSGGYRDYSSDESSDAEPLEERKPRSQLAKKVTGTSPTVRFEQQPNSPTQQERHTPQWTTLQTATLAKPMPPATNPVHTASPLARKAAQELRENGNEAFKRGQFGEADTLYSAALEKLPKDDWDVIALLNNRAAARLKTGEYSGAVEDCTTVLKMNPQDVKSLVRRAAAWEGREKWEEALRDYEEIVRIETASNKQINALVMQGLARVRKALASPSATAESRSDKRSMAVVDDLAFLNISSVSVPTSHDATKVQAAP
ncbi:Mitochondrial import receptor subunit TOM34 [Entophlyctis sp. JEL0112]|nr:Mitochondrial import receptor subunit TOM34 [Entophlyctis sp. JEL0112]